MDQQSATANPGGLQDIGLEQLQAGRDLKVKIYMASRGPEAHRAFIERPAEPWEPEILGVERIEDLRTKLLYGRKRPPKPLPITVTGTLFPCALLSSGWWEKSGKSRLKKIKWRDEIQEWLFHGFDLWGPSWDFSWDFENWETTRNRPHFIAQLGEGDEANSLPVLIPREKAKKLQEYIGEKANWGGIEAEITGILGHRKYFEKYFPSQALEMFGGLLDYCLWVNADDSRHGIEPLPAQTSVYSGYLWRCLAPEALVADGIPSLHDVYYVWEHTNFASRDAVAYNLDALERKQEYLTDKLGKLVLVQKSSFLVPGKPEWSQNEIYNILIGKTGIRF